jgi:glycosyltransferase involved in cell wall biosynthesis
MNEQRPDSGRSLRILIVAHAFPPMNAIGSHRPYSWARCWADLGHEIHVVTPEKHPFDGTMDLERNVQGIGVHVVRYLPLRPSKPGVSVQKPSRAVARWEWLKSATRRARFSLAMFGDPRLLSYGPMVRKGLEVIANQGADLIIATSPPEVVFFVARALSRRTGVPWVADFRDLWFRDMRLHHSRLASSLSGPVNRWLVKDACALVTVSRGLQNRLSAYLGRDVLVSYNGYFEKEPERAVPAASRADGKLRIVYTGRLYPERQNPEPLFEALRKLKSDIPDLAERLSVHFFGFDAPRLRPLFARHGVDNCVVAHEFVSYQESIELQRGADVLLFLDWTDRRAEGVLTGKLFEYLGSGRPILALGNRRDSEAASIIASAEAGITLVHPEEVVEYLKRLLTSGRPPDTPKGSVRIYSRERQARELLERLTNRLREVPRKAATKAM